MRCLRCKSNRVLEASIKATDASLGYSINGKDGETEDGIPDDLEIGGGEYVNLKYCLDCGQMQGKFPLKVTEIESKEEEEEEEVNPMTLSEEDYAKYKEENL